VVFVLMIVATFAAAKATEGNRFCGLACHEMNPYYQTWEASVHHQVNCVQCHIPSGTWNFVKTKFFALREVWVHFTGQVKQPIMVTRKIPNSVCEKCHPPTTLAQPVQLFTASFSHSGHAGKVPYCVDCHAQLVHTPIQGVAYAPPQAMAYCLTCHDGKTVPNNCDYCHQAPHPPRGSCQDCHNTSSWVPGAFHHPVPLAGPHATVLCETCHTQATGTSMGFPAGCIDCHGNHHQDPRLTLCARCHTTTHFVPSTFVHPQEGPHVPTGETPIPCAACHTTTFASASCSCHGGKPPTGGG
jgi:nitrate/TMAO reductase-like tetraheme cytochrome c subunit